LLSPKKQAMERTKPLRQEVLNACKKMNETKKKSFIYIYIKKKKNLWKLIGEAIMESLSQTQHHIRTDKSYIPVS